MKIIKPRSPLAAAIAIPPRSAGGQPHVHTSIADILTHAERIEERFSCGCPSEQAVLLYKTCNIPNARIREVLDVPLCFVTELLIALRIGGNDGTDTYRMYVWEAVQKLIRARHSGINIASVTKLLDTLPTPIQIGTWMENLTPVELTVVRLRIESATSAAVARTLGMHEADVSRTLTIIHCKIGLARVSKNSKQCRDLLAAGYAAYCANHPGTESVP